MALLLSVFGMTVSGATTNHGIDMRDATGNAGKLIIRVQKKISSID